MLRFDSMTPHNPQPSPRKIDVDISEILVGPKKVWADATSQAAVLQRSDPNHGDHVVERAINVGPFAWMNLNFVAVCSLIAVFSTIFIRDGFEYSRRNAHLPADVSDLKREFDATTLQTFGLEPSRIASTLQLDSRQATISQQPGFYPSQEPEFQMQRNFSSNQPFTSLPTNTTGFADRTSAATSSSRVSSESGPAGGVPRATRSGPGSSTSADSSGPIRSTKGRTIRQSRKLIMSARAAISSRRQSLRNSAAARSVLHLARQNQMSTKIGAGSGHSTLQSKSAVQGNLMSMHSLGAGAALKQSHGAINPMRMEGGLLAQPGVGAGLGGVTGNGLGGGGHRAGGQVAK